MSTPQLPTLHTCPWARLHLLHKLRARIPALEAAGYRVLSVEWGLASAAYPWITLRVQAPDGAVEAVEVRVA